MTTYAPADASMRRELSVAVADIRDGARRWPFWWLLSVRQVRSQYARTVMGPWWVTLQSALFVAALTFVFGILFQQDLKTFLPYVTTGFLIFSLLVSMVGIGCDAFVAGAGALKSGPMPLSALVYRGAAGPVVQFGHDFVVIVVVLIACRVPVTWTVLLTPVIFAVLVLNGVAVGLWLGPLGARFRDVKPIVEAVNRAAFFFVPIFYVAGDLTRQQQAALYAWNPYAYLLQALRDPLLGAPMTPLVYVGTAVITVANVAAGILVFAHTRSKIPYWVA